jgi:hypothetical protein
METGCSVAFFPGDTAGPLAFVVEDRLSGRALCRLVFFFI